MEYLGQEKSELIYKAFEANGYIDGRGLVKDKLKKAIKDNTIIVPTEVEEQKAAITVICKKVCSNLNIKPADKKRKVELNKHIFV